VSESENGFAVLGTMRMMQEGNLTLIQATETVNMWIELTAKKFYAEGVLDGLKRNKKPHQVENQKLCDSGNVE
jgi:hypothetical protein